MSWQHHHNGGMGELHGPPRSCSEPTAPGPKGFPCPKTSLEAVPASPWLCVHSKGKSSFGADSKPGLRSLLLQQGFTNPSSALGLGLPLPPHLDPSSTSRFLAFQAGFYLFYSQRDHHHLTATAAGIQSSNEGCCQTGEGPWAQGPVRWLIRGQIEASCPLLSMQELWTES